MPSGGKEVVRDPQASAGHGYSALFAQADRSRRPILPSPAAA
jgi:hypothetical protein